LPEYFTSECKSRSGFFHLGDGGEFTVSAEFALSPVADKAIIGRYAEIQFAGAEVGRTITGGGLPLAVLCPGTIFSAG
jgi:hypothetical protein